MRWFPLRTQGNRENYVVEGLLRLGHERGAIAAPRLSKLIPRRRGGGMMKTSEPFFRSYVFLGLPPDAQGWHAAKSVPGAIDFIRFGDQAKPSAVPQGFVEALISRCNRNGVIELDAQPANVDPLRRRILAGQSARVLVRSGPFAGFQAETESGLSEKQLIDAIARLDARGRLSILVNLFGRFSQIEIDRTDVELLESDVAATASDPVARPIRSPGRRAYA